MRSACSADFFVHRLILQTQEANFEVLMQERRAERADSSIQLLSDQLRSQCSEIVQKKAVILVVRAANKSNFVQNYSRERIYREMAEIC